MRKTIIIPIIICIIAISMALGYNVVHYENFNNYSCNGSACGTYDWYNLTSGGAGLNQMAVDGATATFDYAGGLVGVAHQLNRVDDLYCINPCGNSSCTTPANFSMRVQVWQVGGTTYNTLDSFQFGVWTGRAYQPANNVRFSMNVSNNFRWYYVHDGGILVTAHNHTPDSTPRTIQFDFIMEQDTSPTINQQVKSASVWVDGLYNAQASLTFPTSSNCFNTTWFRYRNEGTQSYYIDELYVVQYIEGEPFINANDTINVSASPTPPSVVECNDTNDNDGDGFTDEDDPQCTYIGDDDEDPPDEFDCNDGQDNEGDNLIDYPQDPSCTALSDDSEDEFDYSQCNDEQDNDNDGLIDYPNDPSCLNFSDNAENQTDFTTQLDDSCVFNQGCILFDSIPYTDSIYLHGWTDLTANELTDGFSVAGGNSLLLKTYNTLDNTSNNFNIYKQFNNQATSVDELDILLWMSFQNQFSIDIFSDGNQSFFVYMNSANQTAVKWKFEVYTQTSQLKIFNINPDDSLTLLTTQSINTGSNHYNNLFKFEPVFDMTTFTYTFGSGTYQFYRNVTPDYLHIESDDYDSTDLDTWFHYIRVEYPSAVGVCTTFQPPYYLKENFISGKLADCGWNTYPSDYSVSGALSLTNDIDYLTIYKGFYDSSASQYVKLDNEYSTITFDFKPSSTSSATTLMTFSIWDLDSNILSFIFKRDGTIISPVQSGTIANLNLNTINTFKLILNIGTDKYDLIINGVMVKNQEEFDSYSEEVTEIMQVYFQSSSSTYTLDNLSVFTSDSEGNPVVVLDTSLNAINNETFWNGLYFLEAPPCIQDGECRSGKCSPLGTCSRFDFRTCEKYGYDKDNYCILANMTRYAFLWVADVILDNFLLFIMFLIILMIMVYLFIMFRNRSG
jgi:hypothetical protein